MGKQLTALELTDLGTYGLNTQANAAALEHQWLTKADNIMLDSEGRITSRKGIEQISDVVGTGTGNTEIVKSLGQFRNSSAEKIFCGAGDKIYYLDTSASPNALTDVTGSVTTPTDGNWQFVNFNDNLYGFQSGHKPIKYDGSSWADLSITTYPDGLDATSFKPKSCLGEFGRLWVGGVDTKKAVVYYSDTLIDSVWKDTTTGLVEKDEATKSACEAAGYVWHEGQRKCYNKAESSAGFIDLKSVWNGDEITALAAFNGKLVIFGKRNIAIYNNPDDPWNMSLDEVIEGIGCVARDSVQAMGDDIIFLSNSGLRSLSRTKIHDKMPLLDYSKNVKDDLITLTINQDMDQAKAQYCLCGGFYILSYTDANQTFIFDFKYKNPDGSPRITKWSFLSKKAPQSFLSTSDGIMYMGQGASDYKGRISKYNGHYDKEYDGSTWTNNSYTATFKTVWMDFGKPGLAKILKRFFAVISGGKNMDVSLKWYRDYGVTPKSTTVSLNPSAFGTPYLWGGSSSLYGAAKYAPVYGASEKTIPLSGSAKAVQIEMSGTIRGYKSSLQQLAITTKQGKIR